MSRRIDIELTSVREDGTWTWRAAGAKQPRGVVDSSLLYEGARAGDGVRAEADFEIEGITIISVGPPQERRAAGEGAGGTWAARGQAGRGGATPSHRGR